MSGISAYATFLCNEDSDSEELQTLESEIKSLIRRKFELECQFYVPRPKKFKEIDDVAQGSKTYGNIKDWDLSNLELKMHFYKLCGIYVTDVNSGLNICFRTSKGREEYFVCLKEKDDCFELDKYHLPPIVPVREISDYLLTNKKELSKFCRKLYHFIVVFEDRLRQIQDAKNSSYAETIELFSSHSTEYIKVEANIKDMPKLSVHLHYRPDFIFPEKLSVDCQGILDEEKAALTDKCQVFKSYPLLEAIRIAILNNYDPCMQ